MSVVVVTGSCGLVGSESAAHYAALGYDVAGIDNDLRRTFFGPDASVAWIRERLQRDHAARYHHFDTDIRDRAQLEAIFSRLNVTYDPRPRIGDHIWYVSDVSKFQRDYPSWRPRGDVRRLHADIYESNAARWSLVAESM